MKTTKYALDIRFTTPILGTLPQKDIAIEHGAKIFEDRGIELPADELGTMEEVLEKGTTAFHKLNGNPILYDYQIKGFIKEAGSIFNGLNGVKALRSKIEHFVFVFPRQIPLILPANGVIDYFERPIRVITMQGPRVAIARSERVPEGTCLECKLDVFDSPIDEDILRYLLDYGAYNGIGQWRGGSWGRFEYTLTKQ